VTLCAFFAGLALGAALFGRRAGTTRRPLAVYAAIEAAAALTALLVPLIVTAYQPIYAMLYERLADERAIFVAVKFALALAAMLPTATLLGGTLPMLAAAFIREPLELGRKGSHLYALNTFGAALGSAAGALWLPEVIGVHGTYAIAIAISLGVGGVALALAQREPERPPAATPAHTGRSSAAPLPLLAVALVSGFGTLGFEVLLIHAVSQSLQNSVYSFGAVLILVLFTLSLGATLVALLARRIDASTLLGSALVLEVLLLLAVPVVVFQLTGGLTTYVLPTFINGLGLAAVYGGAALLAAALVLPLTFWLGEGGPVGPRMGGLLAANTVGGILGSVTASFVLLEWLGLWSSFAALAAAYAGAALLWGGSARGRWVRAATLVAGTAAILLTPANPFELPVAPDRERERVLAVDEGAHGVVSVSEHLQPDRSINRKLRVDNYYLLAGSLAQTRLERMGHLPLVLHGDPKRVLFVGSATGGTAAAAVLHPVEEIVLVELIPEVQRLAAEFFAESNRGVYADARTRAVVEDGRNHLSAAPETYDVVVADLFVPWRPGVGSLFSVEHFRTVKEHLAPGGVFCQWLPLYQLSESEFRIMVASFLAVFPEATLWRGDFMGSVPTAALIGTAGKPPTVRTIDDAARRLRARGVADRWVTEPRGLWMLYVGPLASGTRELADLRLNSDRWPVLEFRAGRATEESRNEFRLQRWPEFVDRIHDAVGEVDPVFPGRPREGPRAGAAFARANLLVSAQGASKRAEAFAIVRAQVPAALLTPPDPTVSEIWPPAPRPDARRR
jgi:spermidine synthase